MLVILAMGAAGFLPQVPTTQPQQPTSRPASRPLTDRERMRPADWGEDAPCRAVMPQKFLPIKQARYSSPEQVADRVRDIDLVIGLVVGDKAVAYPINMLGGPQREIVNEEYGGVPFCVNW